MNLTAFKVLTLNEVRLRLRRTSTLVALLVVAILSWLMIADPASGNAVIVVDEARVRYTSSVIAIGAASLACIMFGLGGFYLVRGRMAEDVRSGTGAVIGATPVSSVAFIASRWAGGMAYLGSLLIVFMFTIVVLHVVRGEGPIELSVYLQAFAFLLMPMLFFAVSFAVLFDSYAPLMGKAGDVLYFFLWSFQLVVAMQLTEVATGAVPPVAMIDMSGIGTCMLLLRQSFNSANVAVGGAPFDVTLAPLAMQSVVWTGQLIAYRFIAACVAVLPVLPAFVLFHRFSPDRVKLASARVRRSPLQILNGWLRPFAVVAQPLFRLAASLPGMAGQTLADLALTLVAAPSAVLALAVTIVASAFLPAAQLGPVLMAAVAFWGVLVSDLATRDLEAQTEHMTDTVPGGQLRRYWRQLGATAVLGMLFTGTAALRFAPDQPVRALAVVVGVSCLSTLASLFGHAARSARLFLALFLFALFVAINASNVPRLDLVGFNGVANAASVTMYALIALGALVAGWFLSRRIAWTASFSSR